MSPIPYVRGQVVVLGLLVVLTAIAGGTVVALACGLFGIGWMLSLRSRYRSDLARVGAATPEHRRRLDRVVAGDALIALVPACVAATVLLALAGEPLLVLGGARGVATALVVTTTAVHASSLVDWYVILPRVSGQLGARPCRAALEEPAFPFPGTWKEVTRWWYIHRAVAAFVFRVGLSAALAIALGELSGLEAEARWLAAAAMLVVFSAYTLAAVGRGVGQAGHAKAILGETVRVERRAGRRSPWFPLRKLPPIQLDSRYYVYDVSIEQVQFADVEPRERDDLPSPPRFETDPDSVYLADVDAVRKANEKFRGCAGRCSGINWYCIENPRCFEPK